MCPFPAMHSKGGAHLNEDLHLGSAAQCLAGKRNFLTVIWNWALGSAGICEDNRASLCVL